MATQKLFHEFFVADALGFGGVVAEAEAFVFLVFGVAALEEEDLGIALVGEDMCADTVEEPAVVADDNGAACEVLEAFLQRAEGVDVDVVGGLVEEEDVGFALEGQRQMEAVAFTAGEYAAFLLLVGAGEIETAQVSARIDFAAPDADELRAS